MKQSDHRVVTLRYVRCVERSTVIWAPIVRFFERVGIVAIPRYSSRILNDFELEHDIDVYASPSEIVSAVLALQTHMLFLNPFLTKIYITRETKRA